jgi:ABC-2 type transport system ATP-binding protein
MNDTIVTRSLTRKFGSTIAIDRVDLSVPQGAIYALVGPNGAGKTSMIKALMNIFRPTAGSAWVLGINTVDLAEKHFDRIGYVSENQEMPDWMTVGEMLDYLRPFYPTWDRALEQTLVHQFDLPLNRKLRHLSRGMRMKAAAASSLAYRPSLIVLDEPFSGLDPLVRDELIESLLERAAETTIFLSSHDLAEIETFSTHVGYLERGHLLFSEELIALSDRFREITVTFASPASLPANPPASWLQPAAGDHVVSFVHSDYRGESSEREVASAFASICDMAVTPMTLRSIFLAVAKAGRTRLSPASGQFETESSRI